VESRAHNLFLRPRRDYRASRPPPTIVRRHVGAPSESRQSFMQILPRSRACRARLRTASYLLR
jgi:hypothetical protein